MATMHSHSASQKAGLPDEDDIYPVHMIDDIKVHRDIINGWTLVFNDVLDADKLHNALAKLLTIGDWRKIGGRLRLKKSGALEIYVPRTFTAERPAVVFTHRQLGMSINDHELAKNLPRATEFSSVQQGSVDFQAFASREKAPATLQDFLTQDMPQLSLYVTSFEDATLVALSFPHTLTDAMGQGALLRAWSAVLAGKDSDVPPLLGARNDAICAALDSSNTVTEKFVLGSKRLGMLGLFKLGLYFAAGILWNWWMGDVETRAIFLSQRTMDALRNQAVDEAPQTSGSDKIFLSDGDVLTAWSARAVAASFSYPRPVTVLQAMNVRYRLSSMSNALGVYIQNSNIYAFTILSASMAAKSLGYAASENRKQLAEQAKEDQVLAYLREVRQKSKPGQGTIILPGPSDAAFVLMTNWSRAAMFHAADFSPAVVRAGVQKGASRNNPPGTMVYHYMQAIGSSNFANFFAVLGKDHGGNYWLLASLRPSAWAVVQADLDRLNA
nr:hypothetical protein CFP56_10178 [Quercus suber]